METALIVLSALNLLVAGVALVLAHRAFQSFTTVVALIRQSRNRR